eukprot:COSAG06_NODE_7731_length_2395_cov_3.002612_1_plen_112_part_00
MAMARATETVMAGQIPAATSSVFNVLMFASSLSWQIRSECNKAHKKRRFHTFSKQFGAFVASQQQLCVTQTSRLLNATELQSVRAGLASHLSTTRYPFVLVPSLPIYRGHL